MAKIKIISNPYQKVTVFQSWDDATAQWVEIDRDQNADSQLLREELCVGFFPFKQRPSLFGQTAMAFLVRASWRGNAKFFSMSGKRLFYSSLLDGKVFLC